MATVFIWNNHMAHIGHTWPGHAAMSIDDQQPRDYKATEPGYVSWIPVEGVSHSGNDRGGVNENIRLSD